MSEYRVIDPSDLMGANIELRNSKGEIIFAMKRKDTHGPTYYIFETHEDRMDSDEDRAKFEQAFTVIKAAAAHIGFPFYDMKEINDALQAQMKAVMETDDFKEASKKVDEGDVDKKGWSFVKDVSFKVFDHATGSIHTLTVGVNLMDMTKDVGADG